MSKRRAVAWRQERAEMLKKLEELGPNATLIKGWRDWCMIGRIVAYAGYCQRITKAKQDRKEAQNASKTEI
jgi:hypothetical protein